MRLVGCPAEWQAKSCGESVKDLGGQCFEAPSTRLNGRATAARALRALLAPRTPLSECASPSSARFILPTARAFLAAVVHQLVGDVERCGEREIVVGVVSPMDGGDRQQSCASDVLALRRSSVSVPSLNQPSMPASSS